MQYIKIYDINIHSYQEIISDHTSDMLKCTSYLPAPHSDEIKRLALQP